MGQDIPKAAFYNFETHFLQPRHFVKSGIGSFAQGKSNNHRIPGECALKAERVCPLVLSGVRTCAPFEEGHTLGGGGGGSTGVLCMVVCNMMAEGGVT